MEDSVTPRGLSLTQVSTADLVRQLLGGAIANRYIDFCKLAKGEFALQAPRPLAGHALRELDSIIRHVLAVPLDALAPADPENDHRKSEALKWLKTQGFDAETLQRCEKELRPRSSHKNQIQKIVTRLGLAPDGEVAKRWISLSSAVGQAHQRLFNKSLKVDDEFRSRYMQPFDLVLRELAIALRGRYAALIRRAEEIAVMGDPARGVNLFVSEIPGAVPLQGHFYERIETGRWLPFLKEKDLLGEPLYGLDGDSSGLRQWPVARYLRRMAESPDEQTRLGVVDAIRAVSSSVHPDVQYDGMDIVAILPAKEAAGLSDVIAGWLTPDTQGFMQAPQKIIAKLAQAGYGDAALRIAGALFQVFHREGRLTTLFDHLMYEHFLPPTVKDLSSVSAFGAVVLFCDILHQAITLDGKIGDDHPDDYTSHAIPGPLSDEENATHDVYGALVKAICTSAEAVIQHDQLRMREVVSTLQSYRARIYERIAMHVLAKCANAAPEMACAYLMTPDLVDADWCRHEYGDLALAWFPKLGPSQQAAILTQIESIPASFYSAWRCHFEKDHKHPPAVDDERRYEFSVVRDVVWQWRAALPDDRRSWLEDGVKEFGDPDAWKARFISQDESPLSSVIIQDQTIDATIAYLKAFQPEEGLQARNASALGNQLRTAVNNDPLNFSVAAEKFADLRPAFLRNFIEGLHLPVANGQRVDWAKLLDLFDLILSRSAHLLGAPNAFESDDPDWPWVFKAMMDLLAAALHRGNEAIQFTYAVRVHSMVLSLYQRATAIVEDEPNDQRNVFFYAQRTARGAAIDLCIRLVRWVRRDPNSDVGRAPHNALALMPDIRSILETEIDDRSSAGRIPRAILGGHLSSLCAWGEGWLRRRLKDLFPVGNEQLKNATWSAHLESDTPIKALMADLAPYYAKEIANLSDQTGPDRNSRGHRLADYLLVLYIWGVLPEELLQQFWNTAPVSVRQHAMWFLGRQLALPPEQLAEPLRAKAIEYWSRRLAAATDSADPEDYRKEIGAIGQWFYSNVDSGWLIDQLLVALKAGFAPNDTLSVVEKLSSLDASLVDRVVAVLGALVKHPHISRWIFLTQSQSVRKILVNGKASESDETAATVREIANILVSKGNSGFLDLADS